ncbi:MAG: hypothetical protein OXI16_03250 [Chloroflexota bacterium]|nr:hypothetical protein [Chloroflexota bacterium]
MPRAHLDLQDADALKTVNGKWRYAVGLVPGEPNQGLVALSDGSPARLPDYDDSGWEVCEDLAEWRTYGLSFIWYRIEITIPETIGGRDVRGTQCLFETCIDDYGEVWVNGELDMSKGAVQGFNIPQRVVISADPQPGDKHKIALLAVNGPIARPGGAVFVRYATLAFEWRGEGY